MPTLDDDARRMLEEHRVGRLATVDGQGRPHVVPFCFALVGDAVYSIVDEKPKPAGRPLRRLRNVEANPRVAFVVDHYEDDWTRLEFLQVHGTAGVVTDPAEFDRVLEALRQRYPQYREMDLRFGRHPLLRVVPERIHRWTAS